MKTPITILSFFLSIAAMAQPTVSVRTSPAKDTIITVSNSSITLTGTAIEANPGHPILDTTWTKTSGPAATITKASNRMTTTITGLAAGTYVFTLTATDKQNSASAVLNVKVLPGILPIELGYFHASHNDKGIVVAWETDMESNNSRFVIQKTSDNSNFTDVAVIESKAKNGNSSTELTYSYQIFNENIQADMHGIVFVMTALALIVLISKLNKVYKTLVLAIACMFLFSCSKSVTTPNSISTQSKTGYRLKQVNMDGKVSYSQIVLVSQ
jgi:hypothetical protein